MAELIKVEKVETYLGKTYRVYVHGVYWGAASTRAKAKEGAERMLPVYGQGKAARVEGYTALMKLN